MHLFNVYTYLCVTGGDVWVCRKVLRPPCSGFTNVRGPNGLSTSCNPLFIWAKSSCCESSFNCLECLELNSSFKENWLDALANDGGVQLHSLGFFRF